MSTVAKPFRCPATGPFGFVVLWLLLSLVICLSLTAFHASGNATTIKASGGIALALGIILGPRMIGRLAFALFLAGLTSRLLLGGYYGATASQAGWVPASWATLVFAWSSALGGLSVVAVYGVAQRLLGPRINMHDWRHLLVIMAVCAGVTAVSESLFALSVYGPGTAAARSLRIWWPSTTLGFLIFTPTFVIIGRSKLQFFRQYKYRLFAGLPILGATIWAVYLPSFYPTIFLIPLALLLVALVCEIEGAALGILVITVAFVGLATRGRSLNTLRGLSLADQLTFLQMFLGILTVVILPVAAALSARQNLQKKLALALGHQERANAQLLEKEQRLRESEARYRYLADNASDIIAQTDGAGKLVYVSPAVTHILGYEPHELIGTDSMALILEEDRPYLLDAKTRYLSGARSSLPRSIQYRVRHRNGHIVWLENLPTLLRDSDDKTQGWVSILRDVTEKRKRDAEIVSLNAELAHAARVSAVGHMSTAIAHELNQPLAAIANYAAAARRYLESIADARAPVSSASDALGKVAGQALRAGTIIRGLREFLEKRPPQFRADDLTDILREAMQITFLGDVGNNVEVKAQFSRTALPIEVDRVQIQQVMHNMLRNSIEAMKLVATRELLISTRMDDTGFAVFEIRDSGPGISQEVLARLFQPFETTKDDGMGMGLSISMSIVQAHGGTIEAENCSPIGACFRVRIPLAAAVPIAS